MCGPGVFQTAAFVLGHRTSKFVHRPYKSRLLVSYNPLALLQLSPDNFKSQLLWGLIFLVLGLSGVELEPLTHWGEPLFLWYPWCCGALCQGCESQPGFVLALLSTSKWPFLYIFSCERAFLLVFRSPSETVGLYVVVALMCPWELSSEYFTVLIPSDYSLNCFYHLTTCNPNASLYAHPPTKITLIYSMYYEEDYFFLLSWSK